MICIVFLLVWHFQQRKVKSDPMKNFEVKKPAVTVKIMKKLKILYQSMMSSGYLTFQELTLQQRKSDSMKNFEVKKPTVTVKIVDMSEKPGKPKLN